MTTRQRYALLICLCGLSLLLGACGQKGSLYLPDAEIDPTVGVEDVEGAESAD